MAVLFITEFAACSANERGGLNPLPLAPSVADQTVAIGATSTQSAALNAATNMVRITCDTTCSVKFGANPTAIATTMRLESGSVEYIGVVPGAGIKIAVITNA